VSGSVKIGLAGAEPDDVLTRSAQLGSACRDAESCRRLDWRDTRRQFDAHERSPTHSNLFRSALW
jgi:hypothetical protein